VPIKLEERVLLRFILLPALICFSLSACVTTPDDLEPELIEKEEFQLASRLSRARKHLASAKYDKAEYELRMALRGREDNRLLLNDLSYVLVSQLRHDEARPLLNLLIRNYQDFYPAYENLAFSYLRAEEYEKARELQLELVERAEAGEEFAFNRKARVLQASELGSLYRNVSIASYALGLTEEAVCYSYRAATTNPTSAEVTAHARLMMSLEATDSALVALTVLVDRDRAATPAPVLVDYGALLYTEGQRRRARDILSQVLESETTSRKERAKAKILTALVEASTSNENKADLLVESAKEDEPALCEETNPVVKDYWPLYLERHVRLLLQNYCIL